MLNLKINNKEYKLPTSFDEITLGEYTTLFKGLTDTDNITNEYEKSIEIKKNEARILSRLLKEPDDFALDLPLNVYQKLANVIQFIYKIDKHKQDDEIRLNGKLYKVEPVNQFSTRRYIDVDMTLKEETPDQFIELLAIMLSEVKEDGTYAKYEGNYQPIKEMLKDVKASQALPILYYFFKKKENSTKVLTLYSRVQAVADQLLPSIPNS